MNMVVVVYVAAATTMSNLVRLIGLGVSSIVWQIQYNAI